MDAAVSGDPDGSGGAIPFGQAGEAGTAAVLAVLIHVPAAEVGIPVELWPDARVLNERDHLFGVEVERDCGWRVVVPWPGLIEWTRWRRGVVIDSRAVGGVEVPDVPPPSPPTPGTSP